MKKLKQTFGYFSASILLILFFLLSACASANGNAENTTADTDVIELPYAGNEIVSSEYTEKNFSESLDLSALYEETVSSVVQVKVSYRAYNAANGSNTGSGFFLTEDGYILTSSSLFTVNGRLLSNSQFNIQVTTDEGKTYSAELIYSDQTVSGTPFPGLQYSTLDHSDLTLIKIINTADTFDAVMIGNSEAVQYGETCYTISSFSDEEDDLRNLISEGIVSRPISDRVSNFSLSEKESYFDGSFDYLIQTTLPTNDGCEGAPVFDADGRVIGVINLGAESTEVFLANPSFGISFSVPSICIQDFLGEVQTVTGLTVSASYSDESFTQQRSENLLLDAQSLGLIENSSDSIVNELIRSDEFLIADTSSEVTLQNQDETGNQKIGAEFVAAQKLNATVKIISVSNSTSSEGSGFIITKDGFVATNLHVVNKDTSANVAAGKSANDSVDISGTYTYALFDNISIDGKNILFQMQIIAYDQKEDMAILKFDNQFSYLDEAGQKISGFENICTLKTQTMEQGSRVYAIGNALGYGLAISEGIVSVPEMSGYYEEYGHNFIQTDCPINSGNSGGPMFDAQGYVVGINSMGLSESFVAYENVCWTIPAERLTMFIAEINRGSVADGVILSDDVEIQSSILA